MFRPLTVPCLIWGRWWSPHYYLRLVHWLLMNWSYRLHSISFQSATQGDRPQHTSMMSPNPSNTTYLINVSMSYTSTKKFSAVTYVNSRTYLLVHLPLNKLLRICRVLNVNRLFWFNMVVEVYGRGALHGSSSHVCVLIYICRRLLLALLAVCNRQLTVTSHYGSSFTLNIYS